MDHTCKISSTVTGRSYTNPQGGSCGSNNLVYIVTCKKCSKQYVGETTNSINKRFYQHMSDNAPPCMSGKTPNPLPNLFAQADHSHLDMKIQILEYITLPPNSQNTRKRELHWIHQLKTFVPHGINSMNVARWLIAYT